MFHWVSWFKKGRRYESFNFIHYQQQCQDVAKNKLSISYTTKFRNYTITQLEGCCACLATQCDWKVCSLYRQNCGILYFVLCSLVGQDEERLFQKHSINQTDSLPRYSTYAYIYVQFVVYKNNLMVKRGKVKLAVLLHTNTTTERPRFIFIYPIPLM